MTDANQLAGAIQDIVGAALQTTVAETSAVQTQPEAETAAATEAPIGGSDAIVTPAPVAALDAWFSQHVQDSAYSRNTDVYNVIYLAVASIKAALASVV